MKPFIDQIEFNSPNETYFSTDHAWVRKNKYGLVKTGVDEVTLRLLNGIKIVNIVKKNTFIRKGEPIFEIASSEKKIICGSPIDGTVMFINPFICGKTVSNAYGDNWIVLIQAENFLKDKKILMTKREFRNFVISELKRLGTDFEKEFLDRQSDSRHHELEHNAYDS